MECMLIFGGCDELADVSAWMDGLRHTGEMYEEDGGSVNVRAHERELRAIF